MKTQLQRLKRACKEGKFNNFLGCIDFVMQDSYPEILNWACEHTRLDMIEYLLEKKNVSAKDAIFFCIDNCLVESLGKIHEYRCVTEPLNLRLACRLNRPAVVEFLLSAGAQKSQEAMIAAIEHPEALSLLFEPEFVNIHTFCMAALHHTPEVLKQFDCLPFSCDDYTFILNSVTPVASVETIDYFVQRGADSSVLLAASLAQNRVDLASYTLSQHQYSESKMEKMLTLCHNPDIIAVLQSALERQKLQFIESTNPARKVKI